MAVGRSGQELLELSRADAAMWLTLLAVRNAIAVLMASLAIVVLGATSLRLSMDLFPNINQPVVTIGTIYTGANVQDIEKTVTPSRRRSAPCPASATSSREPAGHLGRPGLVQLRRGPERGPERDHPAHPADQQHASVRHQAAVHREVRPLEHPGVPDHGLRRRPRREAALRPRLQHDRAPDRAHHRVASANVDGGKIRQIAVNLDRDLLYAKAISVLDVVRSVNDANFLMPSGDIRIGTVDYKLLTNNQFQLVKPMEDIVVRKVGDVPSASAISATCPTRTRRSRASSASTASAPYLRVNKQPAANTIEVVDAVKAAHAEAHRCAARGLGRPHVRPVDVHPQSINSLWHESLQGAVLAFLVILLFLRSLLDGHHLRGDPARSCAR